MSAELDFKHACERHDLSFDYSDDGAVWRAGAAQYKAIEAMAAELPRDVAVKIWNENVDQKIMEPWRNYYYWTA